MIQGFLIIRTFFMCIHYILMLFRNIKFFSSSLREEKNIVIKEPDLVLNILIYLHIYAFFIRVTWVLRKFDIEKRRLTQSDINTVDEPQMRKIIFHDRFLS